MRGNACYVGSGVGGHHGFAAVGTVQAVDLLPHLFIELLCYCANVFRLFAFQFFEEGSEGLAFAVSAFARAFNVQWHGARK